MSTERDARTVGLDALVGPALDYASHLAVCAEKYLDAHNRYEEADEDYACAETLDEEEAAAAAREDAQQNMGEFCRAIRVAIYEYRKRLPDVRTALKRPCPICNGTGLNHGAQTGSGPGYRTIACDCQKPNAGHKPQAAPAPEAGNGN